MAAVEKEILRQRVYNLKKLLKKEHSDNAFAIKLGIDKSIISRVTSKPDKYPITTKFARRIEVVASKKEGWLDLDHSQPIKEAELWSIDGELATDTIETLFEYFDEVDLDPRRLNKTARRDMIVQTLRLAMAYERIDLGQVKESLLLSAMNSHTH